MSTLELTNLESLKIIDFWKIVDTNSVELLDINHIVSRKYTDYEVGLLNMHWSKLYDEFYEYRNNKSGKYLMNKNFELVKLSLQLELLSDIENRLILLMEMQENKNLAKFISTRTIECINNFKKLYPRVKIGMFDNCSEVLDIVQSVIKSQVNIFDEKRGTSEKAVTKLKETIYDVVAIMSKALGYNLNINTMSCMEFIGHENTINSTTAKQTKK